MDESGNTGTSLSIDQPIYWLIAVGVTPVSIQAIESQMLLIASEHFIERAKQPSFEFHGSDLFGGNHDCKGITPSGRILIYKKLMKLLVDHDCALFICGIDKSLHQRRATENGYSAKHPHEIASMYLFEKIDEWLQDKSTSANICYGLLVADEQQEVARKTVENFAYWRYAATEGYRSRTIKYLIDTVHYVPSHDSWLIQLADCVAYIRNRYTRTIREKGSDSSLYNESDKAVIELWENYCRPCIESDRVWP